MAASLCRSESDLLINKRDVIALACQQRFESLSLLKRRTLKWIARDTPPRDGQESSTYTHPLPHLRSDLGRGQARMSRRLQLRQRRSHRLRRFDRDDILLAEAIDATPNSWPRLAVTAFPNHEEVEVNEHLFRACTSRLPPAIFSNRSLENHSSIILSLVPMYRAPLRDRDPRARSSSDRGDQSGRRKIVVEIPLQSGVGWLLGRSD